MGAVLVLLASTLFVVQNEFYSFIVRRTEVQDDSRSVLELLASELRAVVPGGVTKADSARVAVKIPVALGVVCARQGANFDVHIPGGASGIDSDDVAGFGLWNATTQDWSFYSTRWSVIYRGGGNADEKCADEGADTTGASSEFTRLGRLSTVSGTTVSIGDILMIYREIEFEFAGSELDSTTVALYTGNYRDDLTEFASGLAANAHFEYRRGDTVYYVGLSSGLDSIDGIRVVAPAEAAGEGGGQEEVTFTLTARIALPNAR